MDTKIEPTDLLISTDVNALYTNISHTKAIAAIDRIEQENNIDPLLKFDGRITTKSKDQLWAPG